MLANTWEHSLSLLERIDIALQQIGKTRSDLADGVGMSLPAFSKLARRPGSSMKPENVARIARWLGCDLYWLSTGEGGHYVAQAANAGAFSPLTVECARQLDAMPVETRSYAFVILGLVARGERPAFPSLPEPPTPPNAPAPVKRRPPTKAKAAHRGAAAR